MNSVFKKMLLVVGGTLAGIFCVELGLRICGFRYSTYVQPDVIRGWSHTPGASAWQTDEGHAFVKINSGGFRDRERAIINEAGNLRIAVVGDSFVEARQVDLEETFCAIAEKKLNNRTQHSARRIEVLNFGVSGYGTAQELLTLQASVLDYAPDIVILAFYSGNDLTDNSSELTQEGRSWMTPYFRYRDNRLVLDSAFADDPRFQSRQGLLFQTWYTLRHYLRTVQLVSKTRNALIANAKSVANAKSGPWLERGLYVADRYIRNEIYQGTPTDDWEETWLVTEAIIGLMNSEVREMNAQFGILHVNTDIQVIPDVSLRQRFIDRIGVADLSYPNRRIAALAGKLEVPVLDLAPKLKQLAAEREENYHGFNNAVGFGHWNVKGHQVVAALLANWIEMTFDLSDNL